MDNFTDKDLHCIARMLQGYTLGNEQCLYCKYAIECGTEFKRSEEIYMDAVCEKLERMTGVKLVLPYLSTHDHEDALKASWIENHPDLMDKLSKLSLKEQQDILGDPDTLRDICNLDV
jgi:hypothetical protein